MPKQEKAMLPYQKGDELEEAVKLIEQTILNSKPGLKDYPISIETKKIIIAEGVRHEIDVYVEIDLGHGYKSIFIFECKNWEKPVGKNELIIFSEKLNVTNSQKGFFAALKFTKDARNQSEKDKRVNLLEVSTDGSILLSFPDFHSTERDHSETHTNVNFFKRGIAAVKTEFKPIPPENCKIQWYGKPIDLTEFVNERSLEIIERRLLNEPTYRLPSGLHEFEYNENMFFEPGALTVQGLDIERAEFDVKFPLIINRPKIRYAFEVGKRGKVISYESKTTKGHTFGISLIHAQNV